MSGSTATGQLFRLDLRLARRQAGIIAALLAATGLSTATAFSTAFPTLSDRQKLAIQLGANPGLQALYGVGRHLDTITGFTAWRFAGVSAVIAGVWGLLAITRLLAGEEESGRADLTLSGAVSPASLPLAALGAMALFCAGLWAVVTVALLAGGVDAGPAAVIAVQVAGGAVVFVAAGALTSQLAGTRRGAAGLAALLLGAAYLARVVADGTRTLGWIRWATPFGWVEEISPEANRQWLGTLALIAGSALLVAGALVLSRRRDIGEGLLSSQSRSRSSFALLRTPEASAVRASLGQLAAWLGGIGAASLVFGLLAEDVARFVAESTGFSKFTDKLSGTTVTTAAAFLGFAFSFVIVPVALFFAAQITACRTEESSGRLDLVVGAAVDRRRWLAGRTAVAVGGALVLVLASGVLAWLGASLRGADVGFGDMLVAGLNCLPAALVFLAIGALVWSLWPRWTATAAYGSVAVAYLVEIIGAVAKAPAWLLDLSPFHHTKPWPAAPVNSGAAFGMVVIALAGIAVAVALLPRRDLATG